MFEQIKSKIEVIQIRQKKEKYRQTRGKTKKISLKRSSSKSIHHKRWINNLPLSTALKWTRNRSFLDNKLKNPHKSARLLQIHVLPHPEQQIHSSTVITPRKNRHDSVQTHDQIDKTTCQRKGQLLQTTSLGFLQTVTEVQVSCHHLWLVFLKILERLSQVSQIS